MPICIYVKLVLLYFLTFTIRETDPVLTVFASIQFETFEERFPPTIMSPTISFYLLMLLSTLMAAKTVADKTYKIAKNYTSISAEGQNLKIILNYIRDKQIFYPSIFSIVSSDGRSSFVDFLSKYVASESIVSYKITTNDFSRKYMWQSRVDLTWIFIVDSMNIFKSFVHKQSHIWKAVNQYLVIIATPNTVSSREIFQTVWKSYGVYKMIIISIEDDFQCLSRYLPFEKIRQNEYGVVRKVCLIDQENNVELDVNLNNLNGYPIRVVVFPSMMMKIKFDTKSPRFSGLDAEAMSLLERTMKARFHINVINSTNKDQGDPFHRALGYVENGESEIIIISYFVHQYEGYRRYEFTASIYEDKLCLVAPTAGFVPKSYMPVMSFTPNLWVALAIYNILVSVLWFLIKYYSVSFHQQEAVLLPLARMTGYVLSRRSGLPLTVHTYVSSCFDLVETSCYPLKEHGGSTTAQRAFLIGTLFFGLIVTGLYQSCLVSSLSDPSHYPELNTLKDVASSNLTIVTKYYNLKENTFMGNTTLDNKLRSKTIVFVSEEPTYNAVAFGRRMIAISPYVSIKLSNMSRYYDVDGNELLHIVKECPITYSLSYVMKLSSPYRERIDELLQRMQEAGFVRLWYERMVYPVYMAEQRRKMDKSERKIKLTMEHYSFTFVGLTVGLLSCTLVFLAELYFAKRSQLT